MSWQETAWDFGTNWDTVFHTVKMAVCWGLEHHDSEGIEAIGLDEVAHRMGRRYLTMVYQIERLKYICSDMWRAYLTVIARKASGAIHILNRFHIVKLFNKAIDQVRAQEARRFKAKGMTPLKHTRWLLLKRRAHLKRREVFRLKELVSHHLQTVKCYLMKEDFQRLWEFKGSWRIAYFFNDWIERAKRSRIEPMKKLARTLERRAELNFNWFEAKGETSAGAIEGMNLKVKLTPADPSAFPAKTPSNTPCNTIWEGCPSQKRPTDLAREAEFREKSSAL